MESKIPIWEVSDKGGKKLAVFFNEHYANRFKRLLEYKCDADFKEHNKSIFNLGQCQFCYKNEIIN